MTLFEKYVYIGYQLYYFKTKKKMKTISGMIISKKHSFILRILIRIICSITSRGPWPLMMVSIPFAYVLGIPFHSPLFRTIYTKASLKLDDEPVPNLYLSYSFADWHSTCFVYLFTWFLKQKKKNDNKYL